MEIIEAEFWTTIGKLGKDFGDLRAFLMFYDNSEKEVGFRYSIPYGENIKIFVNVTGLDTTKLRGVFFKDKNGCLRST